MTFLETNPYNVNSSFCNLSEYILVWCMEIFFLTCAVPLSILVMLVAQNSCCYIFLGDSIQVEKSTKAFNIEKLWKILNMKSIN